MAKVPLIETLLKAGATEWNKARKAGKVGDDHTGATFAQLFSANADLSGLVLVGTEWEKCDLSKVTFKDSDLSNAYFHGGRLQDCDFRGANLSGCTFERMKLLRCDFSGALGLDEIDFEEVDMDRVVGLDGEVAPPPPPPPERSATSFTREQRSAVLGLGRLGAEPQQEQSELPPFRPQDPPSALLYRNVQRLNPVPLWVLDVPGLQPPAPPPVGIGTGMESIYREATRSRLEGRKADSDNETVKRAQNALRLGSKDAALASLYLREVGTEPLYRFSAAQVLKEAFHKEVEADDPTASVDPRVTGALLELRLPQEVVDHLPTVRRRAAATRLFTSLLEAGFEPDTNWEEAIDSSDVAQELANTAAESREELGEAFRAFASLPEEARLRRFAYLAEASSHLEALARFPVGVEPHWLSGPEYRECHEREMAFVQTLKADEIPKKVAALAEAELGVPQGQVPEDSEGDLFLHFRCSVCGKEKLVVQSA